MIAFMGDADDWAWNGWTWVNPSEMTDGQLADFIAELDDGDSGDGLEEERRQRSLWAKYRLRLDDYDAIEEAHHGRCAICNEAFSDTPRVDHDHATGAIRGLLCTRCNTLLGSYRDDPAMLRDRADRDDAIREEAKWHCDLWVAPWSMKEVVVEAREHRFRTAFERQNGCCAYCTELLTLPPIRRFTRPAELRGSETCGPMLKRHTDSGRAFLYCAACYPSVRTVLREISAASPSLLRNAADYLERPALHSGNPAWKEPKRLPSHTSRKRWRGTVPRPE